MKSPIQVQINPQYTYRLQVHIPRYAKHWHQLIKTINGALQHGANHWSIVYHAYALNQLKQRYGDDFEINFDQKQYPPQSTEKRKTPIEKKEIEPKYHTALIALENWIITKRYSYNTLKSYKFHFKHFLLYHNDSNPEGIDESQILAYLQYLVKEKRVSITAQNQAINAIKCYYEKVLKMPRKVYYIDRPKKAQTLPSVLSSEEVSLIVQAPKNLKHRFILMMVYAAGLRLSEVVQLRIEDVKLSQGKIFIKGGKGKKDRYTLLSSNILPIFRTYINAYQPQYWLFEGQYGDQYSKRSVQNVFRAAVDKAGVGHFATLHTLRHSFATHLMEQGVDTRYVQELLGHASIETTMIYTHVAQNRLSDIVSPLDKLDLK